MPRIAKQVPTSAPAAPEAPSIHPPIHLAAIHKAVALLKASQADFCVIYQGTTFGNLQAAPPPSRTRKPRAWNWEATYRPYIDGIAQEPCFTYIAKSKEEAESCHSATTSAVGHRLGNNTYISAVTPLPDSTYKVEVLFHGA